MKAQLKWGMVRIPLQSVPANCRRSVVEYLEKGFKSAITPCTGSFIHSSSGSFSPCRGLRSGVKKDTTQGLTAR